ncbi:hypothetical protein HLB23_05115 [Nocardia uniformis]|uniref:DUF8020 domain-containing protein n=1 Tax=Nocardia uniformis TaxID=53432 RepID=A0A849BYS2_9NOCA|nr:hypothetical protein [Nocardia uniformis]NNH69255.1 hypothetical protein [Nocardia uniformis]
MKYRKFASVAMMAIAATGIASGTSYGAPAEPAPAVVQVAPASEAQGQDQGVDYSVRLAESGNTVVTQVTGGAFSLDADAKAVTLKNQEGLVVAQVPLIGKVGQQEIALTAAIDNDGRQLSLTAPKADDVSVKFIGSQEWFFSELQRASLGALIGAIIGAFFFGIGLPFGALIGLLIAGGQPLIDSGIAYFSGQP